MVVMLCNNALNYIYFVLFKRANKQFNNKMKMLSARMYKKVFAGTRSSHSFIHSFVRCIIYVRRWMRRCKAYLGYVTDDAGSCNAHTCTREYIFVL